MRDAGAFHIERLRLNRVQLIESRRERRRDEALRQTQDIERERLSKLLKRLRTMIAKIRESESGEFDR